jgi:hypothetical protein
MSDEQSTGKAKGGFARAEALSSDRRAEIAREAAKARWGDGTPKATHDGPLTVGDVNLVAAVLPDGTRLLSQGTFLRAIGRSRTPKAGTGGFSTVDGLPFFLQAEQLKPFVSNELISSTKPVLFRLKKGQKTVGYDAKLLPMVCEVYLKFRDATLRQSGQVPKQYDHIVRQCDILMRGLATVGIIALVDEATGYQEVRDRDALQQILEVYLRQELAAWVKRFPDDFYKEIYRLRGWTWPGMGKNRYSVVAHYTKDLIYERLAPGILEEMENRNPKNERGRRKGALHSLLTEDFGVPKLAEHFSALLALQRASDDWEGFYRAVNRSLPKRLDNLPLFKGAETTPSLSASGKQQPS